MVTEEEVMYRVQKIDKQMQVRARCAQEKTRELTFPSVASTAQLYALFP